MVGHAQEAMEWIDHQSVLLAHLCSIPATFKSYFHLRLKVVGREMEPVMRQMAKTSF